MSGPRPLQAAGPVSCGVCGGEGWIMRTGVDGVDACPRCTRQAEADWRELTSEEARMFREHVNNAGAGSDPTAVTMAAGGGRLVLRVGRGALERLPWFRGGNQVTVLLGNGSDAGRMRVERGSTHRLLDVLTGPMRAKLPDVVLRMDLLPWMPAEAEHAPEPLAHRIGAGQVEVVLPGWAAPPVPAVAPATTYQPGYFLPAGAGRVA